MQLAMLLLLEHKYTKNQTQIRILTLRTINIQLYRFFY